MGLYSVCIPVPDLCAVINIADSAARAAVSRRQLAAPPIATVVLPNFYAECGDPCALSGAVAPNSTFAATPVTAAAQADGTFTFSVSWVSQAAPELTVNGSLWAYTQHVGAQVAPLADVAGATSWSAAAGGFTLDSSVIDAVDLLPALQCPDSVVVALTLRNSTQYALFSAYDFEGCSKWNATPCGPAPPSGDKVVYSAPFSVCAGAPSVPDINIQEPAVFSTAVAGDVIPVMWSATGLPWTATFDVSLVGAFRDGRSLNLPLASGISPLSSLTNGGGTGIAYYYEVTMPAAAVNADVKVNVAVSGSAVGSVSFEEDAYSTYYATDDDYAPSGPSSSSAASASIHILDPLQKSARILVTSPSSATIASVGGSLAVAWTVTGLEVSELLTLALINTDTDQVTIVSSTLAATNSSTTFTLTDATPSPNYLVEVRLTRLPTLSGSSRYFSVVPADTPSLAAAVAYTGALGPGQPFSLSWSAATGSLAALSSSTVSAELWISTLGQHDPNGDLKEAELSASLPLASGSAQLSIPVLNTLSASRYYYVRLVVSPETYITANSPYFALALPELKLQAPSRSFSLSTGLTVPLRWSATSLPPSFSGTLSVDLLERDEATYALSFVATVATALPVASGSSSVTLPADTQPGWYALRVYDASPEHSLLSATSPAFQFKVPQEIRVVAPNASTLRAPLALFTGSAFNIQWLALGYNPSALLNISLYDAGNFTLIGPVTTDAPSGKGYFTWVLPSLGVAVSSPFVIGITSAARAAGAPAFSSPFTIAAPKTYLDVSTVPGAGGVWKGPTPMRINWVHHGVPSTSRCKAELWSSNPLGGDTLVAYITAPTGVACSTSSLPYSPPASTLSSAPFYYIVVSVVGNGLWGRSEFFRIVGTSPSLATLQASLCPALPPQSSLAPLCATTCTACLAAKGVWLPSASLTLNFQLSGFAGAHSDAAYLKALMGAFTSKSAACWPAPAAPGIAGKDTVPTLLYLGSPQFVTSALKSALGANAGAVAANATFALSAETRGTVSCAASSSISSAYKLPALPGSADPDAVRKSVQSSVAKALGNGISADQVVVTLALRVADPKAVALSAGSVGKRMLQDAVNEEPSQVGTATATVTAVTPEAAAAGASSAAAVGNICPIVAGGSPASLRMLISTGNSFLDLALAPFGAPVVASAASVLDTAKSFLPESLWPVATTPKSSSTPVDLTTFASSAFSYAQTAFNLAANYTTAYLNNPCNNACPAAPARRLQGAASTTYITLPQLVASCGAVCAAAPSTMEPELSVSAMVPQFDSEGYWESLRVTWAGAAPQSLLDAPGSTVRMAVYQYTGVKAVNVSAVWWLGEDGETQLFSAPASARSVSLPWDWQDAFDYLPPPVVADYYCADSSVLALTLSDAKGMDIVTVYSPPYYICGGYGLNTDGKENNYDAMVFITYPLNADAIRPYAGRDDMAISWYAMMTPWSATFTVQLVGTDVSGKPVTATVGAAVGAQSANCTALFNANPTSENPDGDGTGAQYTFTFTAPLLADDGKTSLAGASLVPTVTLLNNPLSASYYDAELAQDPDNTQNVTLRDPTELTTSITLTAPAYGATFSADAGSAALLVTWTGTGLLAGDKLELDVVNMDTKQVHSWTVPSATAPSFSASLSDPSTQTGTQLPLSPSVNYQATLTLRRPTFIKSGSSSYFKVLPAGAPTLSVGGEGLQGAQFVLGQSAVVTFQVSDMARLAAASSAPTARVDLWLSTIGGKHDPNGDIQVITLANTTISASGAGSAQVVLPRDPLLAASAFYFFTVSSNDLSYLAAASPYVSLGPSTLTLRTGASAVCGGTVALAWIGTGLTNPFTPLTFDLYTFDTTALKDVLVAQVAAAVAPDAQGMNVTLPSRLASGRYIVYGYNGATFGSSLASATSTYFEVTCRKGISVTTPASFTAGDQVTVAYSTSSIPLGATLKVSLIDPANPSATQVLATDELNKGFFLWATPPDLVFAARYLRIADALDDSASGVTGTFSASAPGAGLSVQTNPSDAWSAGKEVRITWSATGLSADEMCQVEVWALGSDFVGASFAVNITGRGGMADSATGALTYPAGIKCTAKGGIKYTPPATLSTTSKYFVFIITADGTVAGRSEAVPFYGGALPPGLTEVVSSSRRRAMRQLSGSASRSEAAINAAAFPDLSPLAAAIMAAKTCEACRDAGGAYVINTAFTYTFELQGCSACSADDEADLKNKLGAMTSTENFCWFKPEQGQTRAVRNLTLGRTAGLDAQVAALNVPGLSATAFMTLAADVEGTTVCSLMELVSIPFSAAMPIFTSIANSVSDFFNASSGKRERELFFSLPDFSGAASAVGQLTGAVTQTTNQVNAALGEAQGMCSQLSSAVATAGGSDTDVSNTQCSVASVQATFTSVSSTVNSAFSAFGFARALSGVCTCPVTVTTQVPSGTTASFTVSVGTPPGASDAAAGAISSQVGTPAAEGGRVVRLLAANGKAVKAKPGKPKAVSAAAAKKKNGPTAKSKPKPGSKDAKTKKTSLCVAPALLSLCTLSSPPSFALSHPHTHARTHAMRNHTRAHSAGRRPPPCASLAPRSGSSRQQSATWLPPPCARKCLRAPAPMPPPLPRRLPTSRPQ